MDTSILGPIYPKQRKQYLSTRSTSRGRALHTVDWFLNGKPSLSNYDNRQLRITDFRQG